MAPAPQADTTPLFIDTSAWVALIHSRDQAHAAAATVWHSVRLTRPLVTTEIVLSEAHNLLMRRLGSAVAADFADRLLGPGQRVVWSTADVATAAVARWLRGFRDQSFSFADAISFEVMRREHVREAFTFDQHFSLAGFRVLPRLRARR